MNSDLETPLTSGSARQDVLPRDVADGRSAGRRIRSAGGRYAAAALICATAFGSVAAQHLFIFEFKQDDVGVIQNMAGASGVSVHPDGDTVLVTGRRDDGLSVFARENFFGSTTFDTDFVQGSDGVFGMTAPSAVTTSPDGRHVYVTSAIDDSLAVFAYDATTDALAFIPSDVQQNHVGGVFGMGRPTDVAVSADSDTVYVTGEATDSLAIFSRDASTDDLAFITAKLDGGGASNLNAPSAVAVSPDNKHIYVTSRISDSVSVFADQAGYPEIASYVDGIGGEGLDGASGVAVSPDGAFVYTVGYNDDALSVFERDTVSGGLIFVQHVSDGVGGVDGLNGAEDVAVTADRVFVAGSVDNAVAIFRRNGATGEVAFLERKRPAVGLGGVLALEARDYFVYAACSTDDSLTSIYVALCKGDELSGDTDADAICDNQDQCFGDDLLGDSDVDSVCDDLDLCPGFDDGIDGDGDMVPDGCDQCAGDDATGDSDGDFVCDDSDICPGSNDGIDSDADSVPDGCDQCEGNDATGDGDSDGVCNDSDICPGSDDGVDSDADSVPDGCDQCQGDDATGDSDSDAVCDDLDACPGSDDGADSDADSVPDGCDQCEGDDASGDSDGDFVCDDLDCAPGDGSASTLDLCGVCGGNNACVIFSDGFESGNTASWSAAVP